MKESFDNLIRLLLSGDFFLIFLIILFLVIISVVIYLIKLQGCEEYFISDELDEDYEEFENTIPKTIVSQEKLNLNPTENVIKESISEDRKNNKYDETFNKINNYENEQEAKAIISAQELEKRLNDLKTSGDYELHEKEIENYENEQEEKAIISYEELLNRAIKTNIVYESTQNYGGIKVSKIENNFEQEDDKYFKEEEFLKALKMFRESL